MPDSAPKRRMSADERCRQLVAIGLTKLIDTPIHDLSLDDIAAEAGISRSLLFYYFPTKSAFYEACLAAAGRRLIRNTKPSDGLDGEAWVVDLVTKTVHQIRRRREFYLAFIRGVPEAPDFRASVREANCDRLVRALGLGEAARPLANAWWAYVEELILQWTAQPETLAWDERELVDHALRMLHTSLGGLQPVGRC